MFDFLNLDDIEADRATPEWLKWQDELRWESAPDEGVAVLEEAREDYRATVEEEYVYEPLQIPDLPSQGGFDPMGLASENDDVIEAKITSMNGQVIVNFALSAVEELMMAKQQREQQKAYIDGLLHNQVARFERRPKQESEKAAGLNSKLDRKPFTWRDIQTPLTGIMSGQPNGVALAECSLHHNTRIMRQLHKVRGAAILPTSSLLQLVCAVANVARPMPMNMRRNAEWHLALQDVFFPAALVMDDGKTHTQGNKKPPVLVHLVAMSINKAQGAPTPTRLLENMPFARPIDFPSLSKRPTAKLPELANY